MAKLNAPCFGWELIESKARAGQMCYLTKWERQNNLKFIWNHFLCSGLIVNRQFVSLVADESLSRASGVCVRVLRGTDVLLIEWLVCSHAKHYKTEIPVRWIKAGHTEIEKHSIFIILSSLSCHYTLCYLSGRCESDCQWLFKCALCNTYFHIDKKSRLLLT